MQTKPTVPYCPPKRSPLPLFSIGFLLLTSSLLAQAVAPAPTAPASNPPKTTVTPVTTVESEAIVLSPFEVTTTADSGYTTATTLAGNRLSTNLSDLGSAISVINEQFLRDIGATNNETLLQYTTNTEVGNIYGNMANAGSGTQLDETSRFVTPNTNTRIRGLASADNTIDFFLTDVPWDNYNVERVEMQRGPNSILFGLGSPGGIINAASKQATFKTKGQLELRYSRFDSLRASLDYNQVLIPKQLAARLNLLASDERFQQEPSYQRDQRFAAAVRYEPAIVNGGSAHTTFKANFETGRIRSNRPRSVTPGDAITPWFLTGTAPGFNADGTPRAYNNLNKIGFDARGLMDQNVANLMDPTRGQFVQNTTLGGVTAPNANWQPWLGGQFGSNYFGNPMAIAEGNGSGIRFFAAEPSGARGLNAAGNVDFNITGFPNNRMSSITIYRDVSKKENLPGAVFGLTRNLQLSDPSIFDFYNNLIDGPNKKEWQNFKKFDLNFSQTFWRGNAGIDLSYDHQNYDNGQLTFMDDKNQNVFIDVIQTLADGTTNPNFGRPFIGAPDTNNNVSEIDRHSGRFTGFVKYDFAKLKPESFLLRLVGRHVLTGFANQDYFRRDSRSFVRWTTDLAYKDFVTNPASAATIDSSTRAVFPVIYLGPSLVSRSSAVGANISRPTAEIVPSTGSIRVFDSTWAPAAGINPSDPWTNTNIPVGANGRNSTQAENPANYRGWVNIPLNVIDSEQGNRDINTRSANIAKNTISSKALVWNGYLWDGAVVGMYGWRHDLAKAWTYTGVRDTQGRVNLDPSVYQIAGNARDRVDVSSKSWSIVTHLSKILPREKMPIDVSFFYNKSENFQAVAGRVGPLNENLGAPQGDTKDMGIVFATKDGNYSLKLNKYESKAKNVNSSGFNIFYLRQVFQDYQPNFNIWKYKIDTGFDLTTTQGQDPTRWTWQPGAGQTAQQAIDQEAASIVAWQQMIDKLPKEFLTAYNFNFDQIRQYADARDPTGLTITEDNVSKGYEAELYAQPIRNLRLTLNVSKAEAVRSNVGEASLISLVNLINTALNTTAAGAMRNGTSGAATPALTSWNNNMWASFVSIKGQEGGAVPELRKWRANLVASYDFRQGILKGINVGAGYRWQDKVVIGYQPAYLDGAGAPAANPQVAKAATLLINKPYYGPAETNVDLWVGYRRDLTKKIGFRTQLNVRNVGKHDSLIPITVQADGTVAGYRIAPTMVWSLTNTFDF
jgi:outer membrane receptor protein involved in Fe transport